MHDNTPDHTPVQTLDGILCKRDDLYAMGGIAGGKVRACWHLAHLPNEPRPLGLITATPRKSPQAQIVARLAHALGVAAEHDVPFGVLSRIETDVITARTVKDEHGPRNRRRQPLSPRLEALRAKQVVTAPGKRKL